jgi:hypothetical protein
LNYQSLMKSSQFYLILLPDMAELCTGFNHSTTQQSWTLIV